MRGFFVHVSLGLHPVMSCAAPACPYLRDMLKQWNLVVMLGLVGNAATAQVPCVNGFAGEYPCENVELMSVMGTGEVGGGGMNDIWGWVDPVDSKEYVILGRSNGTAFIDISDPVNPLMVANLPTATTSSLWRDVKVHDNHAFIVSEAGGHGMQVVDLTQLGTIENPPLTLAPDAMYSGWGNAHNIVINEATARAYGVGTSTFSGGLHILDISDPTNPTLIGEFSGDGYTHDAQVVNYSGPDANYQGKEIAFCCNENTVTIVDVTDPMDATLISANGYDGATYTHQGWLTEDQHYFISNDELDEQELGVNTTSFIWDVSDLAAPELIGTFVSEVAAIDHNMYVRDTLIYQSNYRAGLRVLSTGDIAAGELGRLDTSTCTLRATRPNSTARGPTTPTFLPASSRCPTWKKGCSCCACRANLATQDAPTWRRATTTLLPWWTTGHASTLTYVAVAKERISSA
mgnify:CR=1 FL=1